MEAVLNAIRRYLFTVGAAVALFAAGIGTVAAQGRVPLHEDPTVVSGFYTIGMADEIRKNCQQITPRLVRAYSFLKRLERYALDAGYSRAEIEGLRDQETAETALRGRIAKDLAARGASPGNSVGYCRVGREEIAAGSQVGLLLRAN